ncbi:MAG: methionyl-tRNA formyltransferase, partial [Alphaproteobacteria bacterium]|nr:methionyl-tRNA formyltransferase [Alphaproteobacteria bacterium]
MKITVFTSNQPRHHALINRLATVADTVYAVMECNTVFPGQVQDFFKKSEVMQTYFGHVMAAEKRIFGDLAFLPSKVRALPIKSGDLNRLEKPQLEDALKSDVYVVFGASYIKGWLVEYLAEQGAYNLHMGISPYYRGSSCNFWALYDNRPEYVGSTVHMLSKGLDSGAMLYHALPKLDGCANPFEFTMKAVDAVQKSVVERIGTRELMSYKPQIQDKAQEL